MRRTIATLLALLAVMAASVDTLAKKKEYKPEDLFGKWEMNARGDNGGTVIESITTIIFHEDMTFEENDDVSLSGHPMGQEIRYSTKAHRQGTFRIDGAKIFFKIDPETMTLESDGTDLPPMMEFLVTAIRESSRLKLYSTKLSPIIYQEIESYRIMSVSDDSLMLKAYGSDGKTIVSKYQKMQ